MAALFHIDVVKDQMRARIRRVAFFGRGHHAVGVILESQPLQRDVRRAGESLIAVAPLVGLSIDQVL